MGDTKPKPKKKKEKDGKTKRNKYQEPGKLNFVISKCTGNYQKIDDEAKKKSCLQKCKRIR